MLKDACIIFGYHAVRAVLSTQPHNVQEILISTARRNDERTQDISTLAKQHSVRIQSIPAKDMQQYVMESDTHQGIIAVCHARPSYDEHSIDAFIESKDNPLLLVLDGVVDPHNLGACLRSANAFGVDCVIAPKDKSASITPTVDKVSCGASLLTPFIAVTNLARCMQRLQKLGVWFVGLDAASDQAITAFDLTMPLALVMGSEGSGMRRLTKAHCDFLAKIIMPGEVSSVNVSVATGIALHETQRQRTLK